MQKRLEEDLCLAVSHVPQTTQSVKGLDWTCFAHSVAYQGWGGGGEKEQEREREVPSTENRKLWLFSFKPGVRQNKAACFT